MTSDEIRWVLQNFSAPFFGAKDETTRRRVVETAVKQQPPPPAESGEKTKEL